MDHASFPYESMYRAKEIFGVNKAIVVAQKISPNADPIYLGRNYKD